MSAYYVYYVAGNVACLECVPKVSGVVVSTRHSELSTIPRCDYCDNSAVETVSLPSAVSLENSYGLDSKLSRN